MDHFCILFLREKDVPARHERRTTYRWGTGSARSQAAPLPGRISRCGAIGNKIACAAAVS